MTLPALTVRQLIELSVTAVTGVTLPALTVRQLIEFSGVYNLAKPGEWKSIVDLDFIGCMLTPGGGKNDIPNRAKRHFHVMNITLPAAASIIQIFG